MDKTKCMHTLESAANSTFNLCNHLKTDMSSVQGKHPETAVKIYVTE
jgi:hypothetical protein